MAKVDKKLEEYVKSLIAAEKRVIKESAEKRDVKENVFARKGRMPLSMDDDAQENIQKFLQLYSNVQEELEPLKKKQKKISEIFKENGWLTADQIRLAKRVYTLYKTDLAIEDLPSAIEIFLDDDRLEKLEKELEQEKNYF